MVQGKKQLSSKPKFAEVVIGDNVAKEMREPTNVRTHHNSYLKLNYLRCDTNPSCWHQHRTTSGLHLYNSVVLWIEFVSWRMTRNTTCVWSLSICASSSSLQIFCYFLGAFNQKAYFCGRYMNNIKETWLWC